LDEAGHLQLHDIVCLWVHVRQQMQKTFGDEIITKHDELFQKGHLAGRILSFG